MWVTIAIVVIAAGPAMNILVAFLIFLVGALISATRGMKL